MDEMKVLLTEDIILDCHCPITNRYINRRFKKGSVLTLSETVAYTDKMPPFLVESVDDKDMSYFGFVMHLSDHKGSYEVLGN